MFFLNVDQTTFKNSIIHNDTQFFKNIHSKYFSVVIHSKVTHRAKQQYRSSLQFVRKFYGFFQQSINISQNYYLYNRKYMNEIQSLDLMWFQTMRTLHFWQYRYNFFG